MAIVYRVYAFIRHNEIYITIKKNIIITIIKEEEEEEEEDTKHGNAITWMDK